MTRVVQDTLRLEPINIGFSAGPAMRTVLQRPGFGFGTFSKSHLNTKRVLQKQVAVNKALIPKIKITRKLLV